MEKNNLSINVSSLSENQLEGGITNIVDPVFGKTLTDRMFQMTYTSDNGWQNPEIKKVENLSLSPAALVFHYGQQIFEGMKCFSRKDGSIGIFRPSDHLKRMNASAERLSMPKIDTEFVLAALKQLIEMEKAWIPKIPNTSLYIRPIMIAIEPMFRLKSSNEYLFFIILSPIGPNTFKDTSPAKLIVQEKYVRAIQGGTGNIKTGCNYAGSLLPAEKAVQQGFKQVIWLDGIERRFIEEAGSMNIFFKYEDVLLTPELNGSILPGITRDSVIIIANESGIKTKEMRLEMSRIATDVRNGSIQEAFGTGTIISVSPIGGIYHRGEDFVVNQYKPGEFTLNVYATLSNLQYGEIEDKYGWIELV